jgi:hypothetical protein
MGEDEYESIMEQVIGDGLVVYHALAEGSQAVMAVAVEQAERLAVALLATFYYLPHTLFTHCLSSFHNNLLAVDDVQTWLESVQ